MSAKTAAMTNTGSLLSGDFTVLVVPSAPKTVSNRQKALVILALSGVSWAVVAVIIGLIVAVVGAFG